MSLQPLLTVSDVAKIFKSSHSWVRKHANGEREPVMPSVKLGKKLMFRVDEIERFVRECSRKSEKRA